MNALRRAARYALWAWRNPAPVSPEDLIAARQMGERLR